MNTYLVGGFNPLKNISQNWIISPTRGENKHIFETTGHVERTVLVPWLVGKVSFHLSYEHYMGFETTN